MNPTSYITVAKQIGQICFAEPYAEIVVLAEEPERLKRYLLMIIVGTEINDFEGWKAWNEFQQAMLPSLAAAKQWQVTIFR